MRRKDFGYEFGEGGAVKRHGVAYGDAHQHCLMQAQVDLKRHAGGLLDAARDGNRRLTAGENAAIDFCTKELDQIAQAMVIVEQENALDRATCLDAAVAVPARGRRYADMFPNTVLDRGGFGSANEFFAALHSGLADPRLARTFAPAALQAVGTVGVPSGGGFSVPTQYIAQWMDASLEDEIVRPRATVWPMTGGEAKVPGFDATSHVSTLYGGFAGGWVSEAQEIVPETAMLRLVALHARKLGVLTEVSNELLADGRGYEEQLGRAITKAIGFFLDYGFLRGTGAPQPLGVLNSPCLITVAKETGQAAATINYQNLVKMFARLHPSSVKNAVWLASQTTIPYLTVLSIPIGAGGSHIPVMSEKDGTFKILTRPVIFTEKVPMLGTVGDIGLYDFSQYGVGLRSDMTLDKSMHPGFTRDTSHYRGILRGDGAPLWNAALTLKDTSTVSPFVVLDTRA